MGKKKTRVNNDNDNNKKRLDRNSKKSTKVVMVVIIALALTVSVGIIGFMTTSANKNTNSVSQNLTGNWMDIHGLGIYPSEEGNDDGSLYLATHNGLFKKDNSSSVWNEIGDDKSDFMGLPLFLLKKV